MLCVCSAAPLPQAALGAPLPLLPGASVSGTAVCSVRIPVEPPADRTSKREHQAVPGHAQPQGQQVQEAGDDRMQEDVADMERQRVQVSVAVVMQAIDLLPANHCNEADSLSEGPPQHPA